MSPCISTPSVRNCLVGNFKIFKYPAFLFKLGLILLLSLFQVFTCLAQNSVKDAFLPVSSTDSIHLQVIENSIFRPGKDSTVFTLLHHLRFINNVDFSGIHFPVSGNFYCSSFDKDVSFKGAVFESFADYSSTTFKKDADFSSCQFHFFLFMAGIQTDSATVFNFYNAIYPPLIDFSHNPQLSHTIDFTNANFDSLKTGHTLWLDSRIFINIYNADINKLKLDYGHFRLCFYDSEKEDPIIDTVLKRLSKQYPKTADIFDLPPGKYEALINNLSYQEYLAAIFPGYRKSDSALIKNFTDFYLINKHFPARLYGYQVDALYSRLLKNFETRGQEDSYSALNTAYQDYRWDQNGALGWLHIFPKYWNWYGQRNFWILFWAPGIFSLLTLVTYRNYRRIFNKNENNKVVYHLEGLPDIDLPVERTWNQKLKNAFIFTSVVFFSFSLKTEKIDFKRPSFYYVVIVNILGLLCLAYLANYILQK